jgi:prolyl-tRNA editing enzyme YbaK/EbsC (Cys-tRNA(Pro) deacylase)
VRRSARLPSATPVVLEAGTHQQSAGLKAANLVRLTRAQVADICREAPEAG